MNLRGLELSYLHESNHVDSARDAARYASTE